jgi:hypothetical protein
LVLKNISSSEPACSDLDTAQSQPSELEIDLGIDLRANTLLFILPASG